MLENLFLMSTMSQATATMLKSVCRCKQVRDEVCCGLRTTNLMPTPHQHQLLHFTNFQLAWPLTRVADMAARFTEYLSQIPVVTASLITLNCAVYCIIFLSSTSINRVAISASQVLNGEYFRIVTSVFVHGGLLHIFFNMSTLLDLGWYLESQFGSMKFAFLSVWSIIITGLLYVFLSW